MAAHFKDGASLPIPLTRAAIEVSAFGLLSATALVTLLFFGFTLSPALISASPIAHSSPSSS